MGATRECALPVRLHSLHMLRDQVLRAAWQRETMAVVRAQRQSSARASQFNQQLGHGAFKAVFKGYDEEEGIEVAWCQVNMDRVGEVEKAQIHTEVDILKSLTHKVFSCACFRPTIPV